VRASPTAGPSVALDLVDAIIPDLLPDDMNAVNPVAYRSPTEVREHVRHGSEIAVHTVHRIRSTGRPSRSSTVRTPRAAPWARGQREFGRTAPIGLLFAPKLDRLLRMTNSYCVPLGIAVPRLEAVRNHPAATTFALLIVALLERGGPMTFAEVAARFEQAGTASTGEALRALQRCRHAHDRGVGRGVEGRAPLLVVVPAPGAGRT